MSSLSDAPRVGRWTGPATHRRRDTNLEPEVKLSPSRSRKTDQCNRPCTDLNILLPRRAPVATLHVQGTTDLCHEPQRQESAAAAAAASDPVLPLHHGRYPGVSPRLASEDRGDIQVNGCRARTSGTRVEGPCYYEVVGLDRTVASDPQRPPVH